MRAPTILLVSLGGALAAGSASVAVGGASADHPRVVVQVPAPGGTDTTTPRSSSVPDTAVPVPEDTALVGVSVPGTPTQRQFVVGDAATVIVDTVTGQLQVVRIAPHPGWVVVGLEQRGGVDLEIRLESANDRVRFDATLAAGEVTATLRTDDETSSTTPASGSVATTPDSGSVATTPGSGSVATTPGSGSVATTPTSGSTVTTAGSSSTVTTPGGGSTATTADDGDDNSGPGGGDDSGGDDNSGSGGG